MKEKAGATLDVSKRSTQLRWAFLRTKLARIKTRITTWFRKDPEQGSQPEEENVQVQSLLQTGRVLKGGAAKLAQLLGYWYGSQGIQSATAKEKLAETFDQLSTAQDFDMDEVFITELGKPPLQLFSVWDPQPFAAASLGQVHKAKSFSGDWLAVKVQYPGIAAALRADVENPELLESLTQATLGMPLPAKSYEAVKTALLDEIDYVQEALFLKRFAQRYSQEQQLVFPQAEPSLSSKHILTTTYVAGVPLLQFLPTCTEGERSFLAESLFLYGFVGPLQHGLLNADPNPGNFLILNHPLRLGCVDFGCCVQLSEEQMAYERVLWQALLAQDAEVFRYTLLRMGLVQEIVAFDTTLYREWERLLALPFQQPQFAWTVPYASDLISQTHLLLASKHFTLPPAFLLLWRQRLGLFSVLALIQGTAPFRRILLNALSGIV